MKTIWLALTATSIVSAACTHTSNDQPTPVVGFVGTGWTCLAAPSAFDGPGTIFRVTSEKVKFTVGDYAKQAAIQTAPWIQPTATQSVDVSAGIIAKMIGIPLSTTASAASKYQVQQSFQGAEELNTTDDSVKEIITAFYRRADLDSGQSYYLVRRAVVAKTVTYTFNRDLSSAFGAAISAKVVEVNPTANYSRVNGFRYTDTFLNPQNVCVLAQRLPVPRPTQTAPAAPTLPLSIDEPLFTTAAQS